MKNLSHPSWISMRPIGNEDAYALFERYYQRMMETPGLAHIPREVYKQWIVGLHQDPDTLRNYSWLDYQNISFSLVEWDTESLFSVTVFEDFQDFYDAKSSHTSLMQFCCSEEELLYWKTKGTWMVPPIVLNVGSLKSEAPEWSELNGPFQLVEGHTRLGYLNSMKRISSKGIYQVASKHRIYLMEEA